MWQPELEGKELPKYRYTVLLKPDPEQGGYWVEAPTLPGPLTHHSLATGRVKEKVLPWPGSLSQRIWPPCASTMRRLM